MDRIRSFLDNNSVFGRVMWRCGVLIGANLMFIFFSIPLVTVGAAYTAMHYAILKTLRGRGQIRVTQVFWQGFKENFKQATAAWLILLALAGILGLELFWCSQFTGPMAAFRYGIMALLVAEVIIGLYLFPTMAAFRATLPQLVKNSIYFAIRRPLHLIAILFASIVPLLLTYLYLELLPLFAFLWAMIGFSFIAMFCDSLLIRQFIPYLPPVDAEGDIIPEGSEAEYMPPSAGESEAKTLAEMRKYGL